MNILITGGAGFIGSHLSRRLLGRHRVTVIDDLSSGRRSGVPRGARFVRGDVRELPALTKLLRSGRIEVVLHLAAQANVRKSLADPARDFSVNALGGLAVLEACAAAGVRRLVYASSGGAVYGDARRLPCRESDVPSPISPYGLSKLAVERFAERYRRSAGLEVVTLRLANVYGPGQDPAGESGLVAILADRVRRGLRPTIFGDGSQTRDYVHVGDVVRAFDLALRGPQGTYNVGTGVETSVRELLRRVGAILGSAPLPRYAPGNAGEVRRSALDAGRAARSLGWEAETSLSEGLRGTLGAGG